MARLHRRSFMRLAGAAGAGSVLGVSAPAIIHAATPVKMTLPWLPLGTFSYAFVAKKMGFSSVWIIFHFNITTFATGAARNQPPAAPPMSFGVCQ